MDPAVPKDIWWFISEFWSTTVVALIIYGGGLTATRVALSFVPDSREYLDGKTPLVSLSWPLLFRLWATTRVAHPFLVGSAIAFIPGLPRPEIITSQTSAVLWFGFAGMMNGQIHQLGEAIGRQIMKLVDLIVPWVRARIGLAQSTPSPAPAALPKPATDPHPTTEIALGPVDERDPDEEREAMEAEVAVKVRKL